MAPLLTFAVAHVAIFAGLFRGVYTIPFSGTGLFYEYAGKVLTGAVPYRDFVLEYPPFALVFFTLPRVLGESFRWYYVFYQTEVVLFDLVIVATLYGAARQWGLNAWRVLAIYTVAVLAVGPIILQQFDIFSAALTLLAVVSFSRRRHIVAGVCLGLAIMTKVYPVLLAPVFILLDWREGSRRGIVRAAGASVAACVAVLLPWLIAAPTSLGVLVAYHAQRGTQIESTYGSIALLLHETTGARADAVFEAAAWSLVGPMPQAFARASTAILILVLACCYVVVWREASRRSAEARTDIRFVVQTSAFVLTSSLVASKVLSPQYLIWLLPLVPLVAGRRRRATWILFAIIGVLTYCIFPMLYSRLLQAEPVAVAVLVLRNVLLVVLAVVLGFGLRSDAGRVTNQPSVRDSADPATL